MFSPFVLILIPLGGFFLWPLLARLLVSKQPLQIALTALAFSTGTLAFSGFVIGLLPGQFLTGFTMLLIIFIGFSTGLIWHREWLAPRSWQAYWQRQWARLARLDFESLLLWTMLGSAWIILIHSLYYPFVGDDTLARYGLHAKQIYFAQRLPIEVWGYPPLVPIGYALIWHAAGQINEHLAKLLPVAMAIGTLGATYLLGRSLFSIHVGLLAGALMALTPLFIGNASLDYTDIPTAFPLVLAVVYVVDWWRSDKLRDALIAGVLLAIALLTKQSALTWVASFVAVPLLWLVAVRRQPIHWRWWHALCGLAAILAPVLIIAAPWYVRNALIGSWKNALPIAGEYHLLEPWIGWIGLIPPLAWTAEFGSALRWVYMAGWIVGFGVAGWEGWHLLTGQRPDAPPHLIVALMVIPYWLAWWIRFSFDPRFLVIILPLMALWAAFIAYQVIEFSGRYLTIPQSIRHVGGAAALVGLLVLGAQGRLGGVYHAVTDPFAPESERRDIVQGGIYDLARYIREYLSPDDRILAMDGRLAYYLTEYDVSVAYPLRLSDLEDFDYLVHSSSFLGIYTKRLGWNKSEFYRHVWHRGVFDPVYVSNGVHIMRIVQLNPSLPRRNNNLIPKAGN